MSLPALVTCGPAYEPIDKVRRITNHSTGELGTILCEALHASGFRVLCLRGDMATYPAPKHVEIIPFSTNSSLSEALEKVPENPAVIFHAAALCDFQITDVGNQPPVGKIRSDTEALVITLRPTGKLLLGLRELFPESLIVGWKYELDGSRADAIGHGRTQITRADTDACVVNGSAYGPGFGFVEKGFEEVPDFSDKRSLSEYLVTWTQSSLQAAQETT